MMKNSQYEINFASNTITVSKQFLRAASQIGTTAFATMTQLRALNMPIIVREIHRKRGKTRWSFERMERFLQYVADSEKYLADYHTFKESCGYMTTWAWFNKTFLSSKGIAELDENHRILVMPRTTQQEDVRALKAS